MTDDHQPARRARAVRAVALAALAMSCHTGYIQLERSGSASVPSTAGTVLQRFFDGRYVPLPSQPFVNCFDAIAFRLPVGKDKICTVGGDYQAYRGYAASMVGNLNGHDGPGWLRDSTAGELRRDLRAVVGCFASRGGTSDPVHNYITDSLARTRACHVGPLRQRPRAVTVAVVDQSWPVVDADVHRPLHPSVAELAPTEPLAAGPQWFDDGRGNVGIGVVERDGGTLRVISSELRDRASELAFSDAVPRPVLSFVHLSDAQIREPAAQLGGQAISSTFDRLIHTFKHDYEQELFSGFFYEAIIKTVNAERVAAETSTWVAREDQPDAGPRWAPVGAATDAVLGQVSGALASEYRIAPSFAVHTGDSVDAGLQSEFDTFRADTDLLTVPWYSLVGNHDILGIGNLDLRPDARSEGDDRPKFACTPLNRLLREYYLVRPDGNGDDGERRAAATKSSDRLLSIAPLAVRTVCLGLDVENDRFVGRPTIMHDDDSRPLPAPSATADEPTHDPTTDESRKQRLAWVSTASFARAHCRGSADDGVFADHDLRQCRRHLASPNAARYYAESRLNGFDICDHDAGDDADRPCVEGPAGTAHDAAINRGRYPGYYEFRIPDLQLSDGPREIWGIALNTAHDDGAFGALSEAQLAWLEHRMDAHRDALVIVFAHHQIWGIENDEQRRRLKAALFRYGNVIGYFAGHTHVPLLRVVEEDCPNHGATADNARRCGSTAHRLWEVIAPSTIEFPQLARQVTLVEVPGTDLAYFELLTFEPHIVGGDRSYVERANAGAKRDWCEGSSKCHSGEPPAPPQYINYPRLWLRMPARPSPPQ